MEDLLQLENVIAISEDMVKYSKERVTQERVKTRRYEVDKDLKMYYDYQYSVLIYLKKLLK